jgi:hypothetical protein
VRQGYGASRRAEGGRVKRGNGASRRAEGGRVKKGNGASRVNDCPAIAVTLFSFDRLGMKSSIEKIYGFFTREGYSDREQESTIKSLAHCPYHHEV